MSVSAPEPFRWINWHPRAQTMAGSEGGGPTKPSKPGSVGFVGSTSGELPIIRVGSGSVNDSAREHERGVPWAEWKAAALNKLFKEQGVTGQPGRITAATVEHGEKQERGGSRPKVENL